MDALVADFPGLTRDRQYGDGRLGQFPYLVIDTGGQIAVSNMHTVVHSQSEGDDKENHTHRVNVGATEGHEADKGQNGAGDIHKREHGCDGVGNEHQHHNCNHCKAQADVHHGLPADGLVLLNVEELGIEGECVGAQWLRNFVYNIPHRVHRVDLQAKEGCGAISTNCYSAQQHAVRVT